MERVGTLFELEHFLEGSDRFHFSKNRLSAETDLAYHRHDYFELFWVSEGKGHHLLNGKTYRLAKGDLLFMRPGDSHTFSFDAPSDFVLIYNLAFFPKDVSCFQERYLQNKVEYFWTTEARPQQLKADEVQLKTLSNRADELLGAPRSLFYLDNLLLYLFDLMVFSNSPDNLAPFWLKQAIGAFNAEPTGKAYQEGVAAFLALCGRSNAHVNRSLGAFYGQNVTNFVNGLRLRRAKQALTATNKGIKEIAFDLGFNDVNYFHKLFKAANGLSPNAYRNKKTIVF